MKSGKIWKPELFVFFPVTVKRKNFVPVDEIVSDPSESLVQVSDVA